MDGNGFPSAPQRGPGGPVPITTIPLIALRPIPTTTTTTTTTSSSSSSSSTTAVTLTSPRPEVERRDNEYVETPLRGPQHPNHLHQLLQPQQQQQQHHGGGGSGGGGVSTSPAFSHRPSPPVPPVDKQPLSSGGGSVGGGKGLSISGGACGPSRPSIMCTDCGRCKCATCREPKPLPECWSCNGTCLVSADSIVDYASCLCCVKAVFYHCSEADDVDNSCADDPCGCGPDRRVARWGCLAPLACALPCLLLYWPLRCAKRAVELCYERHSRSGCRCRPPKQPPRPPAKRLLGNDSLQDF